MLLFTVNTLTYLAQSFPEQDVLKNDSLAEPFSGPRRIRENPHYPRRPALLHWVQPRDLGWQGLCFLKLSELGFSKAGWEHSALKHRSLDPRCPSPSKLNSLSEKQNGRAEREQAVSLTSEDKQAALHKRWDSIRPWWLLEEATPYQWKLSTRWTLKPDSGDTDSQCQHNLPLSCDITTTSPKQHQWDPTEPGAGGSVS